MFRKDLTRRMEKVWASYKEVRSLAISRVNSQLGNDEFPKPKKQLFCQALEKGEYSSPVIREWVQLAERHYPRVPWRRVFGLGGGDEDQSG